MTNPLDKIDSLPNKSGRYFSLVAFILVGVLLVYIATNLDHALHKIIQRQIDADNDRLVISTALLNTEKLLNSSIDEINLTAVNHEQLEENRDRIIEILEKQNLTNSVLHEVRDILNVNTKLTKLE